MTESAALLVDDILPEAPVRQWVLSFPYAFRLLFATRPKVMGQVLGSSRVVPHEIRGMGYACYKLCFLVTTHPLLH
jgi:hypothetical protein